MTDKMPEEWEIQFLNILRNIQENKNAYWIQTRHIAIYMFGNVTNKQEWHSHKMRVYRLGQRLIKKGLVITTHRRERIGKSTGKSLIIYYHTDFKGSVYSLLKKGTEEKKMATPTKSLSVVEVLERQAQLIDRLKVANMDELVSIIEELAAINQIARTHLLAQKKFINACYGDKFVFDKDNGKMDKVFEEKQ